jgi:hypothetical protein
MEGSIYHTESFKKVVDDAVLFCRRDRLNLRLITGEDEDKKGLAKLIGRSFLERIGEGFSVNYAEHSCGGHAGFYQIDLIQTPISDIPWKQG